jgi:formamidopyrimidine-DNA glycosylase
MRRAGEALRHVAVTLHLTDGRAVLYDDARRFGDLDLRDERGWAERDAELGVEPLSDAFTAERLHALTRTSITPIRNWLLDQRRVAGVGNIYAVEALFRAGIRPTRRARRWRAARPRACGTRCAPCCRSPLTRAAPPSATTATPAASAAASTGAARL